MNEAEIRAELASVAGLTAAGLARRLLRVSMAVQRKWFSVDLTRHREGHEKEADNVNAHPQARRH